MRPRSLGSADAQPFRLRTQSALRVRAALRFTLHLTRSLNHSWRIPSFDEQWGRLAPLLPINQSGAYRKDDWQVTRGSWTCCATATLAGAPKLLRVLHHDLQSVSSRLCDCGHNGNPDRCIAAGRGRKSAQSLAAISASSALAISCWGTPRAAVDDTKLGRAVSNGCRSPVEGRKASRRNHQCFAP